MTDDWTQAKAIIDSRPVIGIYASCEWDEMHVDYKEWIAAIVSEARAAGRAEATERAARLCSQAAADLANQARAEFSDHQQFDAGREYQALRLAAMMREPRYI